MVGPPSCREPSTSRGRDSERSIRRPIFERQRLEKNHRGQRLIPAGWRGPLTAARKCDRNGGGNQINKANPLNPLAKDTKPRVSWRKPRLARGRRAFAQSRDEI